MPTTMVSSPCPAGDGTRLPCVVNGNDLAKCLFVDIALLYTELIGMCAANRSTGTRIIFTSIYLLNCLIFFSLLFYIQLR